MREYIDTSPRATVDVADVDREQYESNNWSDIEMIWDDVVTITGDVVTARQVWEYLVGAVPACGSSSKGES